MYLPSHFEKAREEDLLQTIAAYPLGTLVINGPQGLDANHVPFFPEQDKDGKRRLLAHVARGNPLWKESTDGQDAAPEYIDEMLTKIVGIEVEVVRMVGKWKLSQNREERDRTNAAEELQKRGAEVMAAAMLKTVGENG